MGYYISAEEGKVTIPAENLDEAYRRMCALNDNDSIKRGGMFGSDDERPAGLNYHPHRWFSWMDADYPSVCSNAKEIFEMLGFECSVGDDGSLTLNYYESKMGQESLFLAAVSPLCTKDSYFIWRGEDSESWKHQYGEEQVIEFVPDIRWVRQ